MEIPQKRAVLENSFGFLVADFGYHQLEQEKALKNALEHILIHYRNDAAGRDIEFYGKSESDYFHCELRRVIGGQPAPYSDRENSISHYELAVISEGASYEWENWSHYSSGWKAVIDNTVVLLKKNADLLRGGRWFDRRQLEEWKTREFVATFKVRPRSANLIDHLRVQLSFLESDMGYRLVSTSADLPAHRQNNIIRLRYEKNDQWIEIVCPDIHDWMWEIRATQRQKVLLRKVFIDQLDYELQNIPQLLQ